MNAAALVREARAAGVTLRLVGPTVKASGSPSPELLSRLREAKPAIAAILRGDACRTCGGPLVWPRAAAVVFADGTAECIRCADAEAERLLAAGRRAVESADALADPAEMMLQHGGLS